MAKAGVHPQSPRSGDPESPVVGTGVGWGAVRQGRVLDTDYLCVHGSHNWERARGGEKPQI
ncbi:hypothetical protein [Gloeocapsa sp. PCC 7428]|nr:hypothetical protein [Gloeocapsa sp. PCC 7428]